jgi:predicted enzyme related to lactoylglutathione lyase
MPYFAAGDPDAQAKRALELGGEILVPMMDFPGGRFAVVQDVHRSTFGLLDLRHG